MVCIYIYVYVYGYIIYHIIPPNDCFNRQIHKRILAVTQGVFSSERNPLRSEAQPAVGSCAELRQLLDGEAHHWMLDMLVAKILGSTG